jgi:cellulose synthase/poly-beta-1,6-N-acetylglucosamine synthase-like glycosyltransferase
LLASGLIALAIVSGSAVILASLLTLHVWECHRFAVGRVADRDSTDSVPIGRVALFLPCKGDDVDLDANLRAVFEQDYGNFEIIFMVESEDDPACERISHLRGEYRDVTSQLVICGRATQCGQKVHNLQVATEGLDEEIDILAFVDSDVCPDPHWLRALVSNLYQPGTGATTGYRWFVPRSNTPANLLLYSINSAVASLFGRHGGNMVWGGAWAIRRDVFDGTALRDAWCGTLSDDMVASRVLRGAGLHIAFEPRCVTASPIDATFGQMLEFLRRQYLIGRCYVPQRWQLVFAGVSLGQLGLWSSLAGGLWAWLSGSSLWWPFALSATLLYALAVSRAWLRQDLGRKCFPDLEQQLHVARQFDVWAAPVAGLFNWMGSISSAFGSSMTWRGIRYWVMPGGKILLLGRRLEDSRPSRKKAAARWRGSHSVEQRHRSA